MVDPGEKPIDAAVREVREETGLTALPIVKLADPVDVQRVIELPQLLWLQAAVQAVYVDPAVTRYAVRLASVTRDLGGHGLEEIAPLLRAQRRRSPRKPRDQRRSAARS